MNNEFLNSARNYFDMMVELRRELHKRPEVDRNLTFTVGLVENYLRKLNVQFKTYNNCAIIGEIGQGDNIIALRADMDALEVIDLKQVDYKSTVHGLMHACGHDAHTSILVGAAAILKSIEDKLKGRIRLIFQPAEETDGGAKDMIELGALEGVEAIIGLHVDETIDVGTIGVKKGVVSAASNPFKITVQGKGAHGAYPADGVDAIYISSKIIDGLQGLVSREISATDSAVVTVGKINGGTSPNAICSKVVIEGIIRTLGSELREFSKERLKTIVDMTARMYRGQANIELLESYPSFRNDGKLFEWFSNVVKECEWVNFVEIEKPMMGVEDFAYYTEVVPGLYYKLGCRNKDKGIIHPAHGSYFDIDEDCLIYGAALQSMAAFKYFEML
jgi:amidohydrolase